jgi:rhomboid protease GluP
MLTFLVFLIIVAAVAYRAMTPDDRARTARKWLAFLRDVKATIDKRRSEPDTFREALHARTPWVVSIPLILGLNVVVFAGMLFGTGSFGDPETLISWGGSFGPRTTNGEWWRVVTSLFVHAGFFHLVINGLALLQLGFLVERLMGRTAVLAVFAAAGTFSNIARLSAAPVVVHTGEGGAIFGLFGLLLASCVWGVFHKSAATVPLRSLRRLLPVTVVFLLYNGLWDGPDTTGFIV